MRAATAAVGLPALFQHVTENYLSKRNWRYSGFGMRYAVAIKRRGLSVKAKVLGALLLLALAGLFASLASAALRTAPGWWDPDGVGSGNDWHYRVPVTVPAASTVNSTGKVDIDFAALMTQLGISGTFDPNSVRVIRPGGTVATIQEYNDTVYAGATDSSTTRGEVRWIIEDGGAVTYYVYFDITQNGSKPANPQTPINGNFERDTGGTQLPTAWSTATKTNALYDAQVRPSESPSITSDGGPLNNPTTTDGTPRTGLQSYMLGARTNNEPGSQVDATKLTRTITVPATTPGNLVVRWRPEGWDSDTNGTTVYDNLHIRITTAGGAVTEIVGPATNDYRNYPFSPNYGNGNASATTQGYGHYNGFDMTTGGTHQQAMTVAYHAQPWWTRTYSLAAFAGQTVTISFATSHVSSYRTWFHIDDVEWSVVTGTLGNAEGFGVSITSPSGTLVPGQTLAISARVDAKPTAASAPMTVNVYNNAGTLVATAVTLFNDGTHGDAVANDAIWTNNGSDSGSPTYTIPLGTASSAGWMVRAFAKDASTSTLGAAFNGLVHRNTLPSTAVMANYWNIDEITFSVVGGSITATKLSAVISDPVNGTTNPKAIPGAVVEYCILMTNSGATTVTNIVATDIIPSDLTFAAGTITSGASCAAATTVEDDNNIGTDETDPIGASVSGTTVTATNTTLASTAAFAFKFRATVN
jgi:uncharacterized repeat protein (TIGR01451 family)